MIILWIIVIGMAAGWAAGGILGQRTTRAQQLTAGLIGSFVGGMVLSLLAGDGLRFRPSGVFGSILGAIIVLALWRPKAVPRRR